MNWLRLTRRNALKAIAFGASSALTNPSFPKHPVSQPPMTMPDHLTQMTSAAVGFLNSLDESLRQKASYDFNHAERTNWHWIARNRQGVSLKELNPIQRNAGLLLLHAGADDIGYQLALDIASLEKIYGHDPDLYYFTIFGVPSAIGRWGWRFEGHHLSMNFTLESGQLSASPLFFGAWPTEAMRDRPRDGMHTLLEVERLARQLLLSLDPVMQQIALISSRPFGDVTSRKVLSIQACSPVGLPAGAMNDVQRGLMLRIINLYLGATIAGKSLMARVHSAGIENIHFAWAGSPNQGERYSYRLQGRFFMLEHDNSRNGGTHLHSAWREFEGDFGCVL